MTPHSKSYDAFRRGAALMDRSGRGRMIFRGGRRQELVTGLVTNDIGALAAGSGAYAAALTAKGKIVADIRVFALTDDTLITDTAATAFSGWSGIVKKYINPRLAPFTDITEETADIGVFGPRAAEVLATLTGSAVTDLATMGMFENRSVAIPGCEERCHLLRVPDAGVDGFELLVPRAHREDLMAELHSRGAVPGDDASWTIVRVEAGRPEWGLDMDENTLPQEANLDALNAISYTKGCYTGQETVARIHFRGHVNRRLCGLSSPADSVLLSGATLDFDDKPVGTVTTVVESPRLGAIALGMVRREIEAGAEVFSSREGRRHSAIVVGLPFPD